MSKRLFIFSAIAVAGLFLFTRLYQLTLLPIFTDESIYIYWAKIIATTHGHLFISLTDGKPPLFEWMITVFLWILPQKSYMLAGRLPSVISGLISLVGIYFLAEELFENKVIAMVSALLYVVFPFALLYDRLALFDSLLQAMLVVATYFAVKTAKQPNLAYAVLWGFFLGLAFFAKPTALLYLGLLPFGVILLQFSQKKPEWKKVIAYSALATVIGEGINLIQHLSKVYFMMVQKDAQFQIPFSELLFHPFIVMFGNMQGFYTWIVGYYTWPFLLFGVIAFIYLLVKSWTKGLMLLTLWFIPVWAFATVGREIFPRYILFISPYFLIAVSAFLYALLKYLGKYGWIVIIIGIVLVLPFIQTDYFLLVNPPKAQIPVTESAQMITSQSSGYGIPVMINYLNNQLAKGEHIYLVTQGTFGDYPYAFNLEYWGNPNMTILPRWPLDSLDPQIIQLYQQKKHMYILFKEHAQPPANLPVAVVLKATKPGGSAPMYLTEIKSSYQP